jgi:hypothetical protein
VPHLQALVDELYASNVGSVTGLHLLFLLLGLRLAPLTGEVLTPVITRGSIRHPHLYSQASTLSRWIFRATTNHRASMLWLSTGAGCE